MIEERFAQRSGWVPSWTGIVALAFLAIAESATAQDAIPVSPATTASTAGMVNLRELVPDLRLDIRYRGSRNFTGAPVDGYAAPECYLLRPVAAALRDVEFTVRKQNQRLQIFDCYRPVRAVQQFVSWAQDVGDQRTKGEYYPHLEKAKLLGDYISASSGHSRGATVDLTLLQCGADGSSCAPLDMGTAFDFFDPRANTDSPAVTPAQRRHRDRLRAAMQRAGFANYALEWWHYTLPLDPPAAVAFDFVIR